MLNWSNDDRSCPNMGKVELIKPKVEQTKLEIAPTTINETER